MQTVFELPVSSGALEVQYPQLQLSLDPVQEVKDSELNKVQLESLKALALFPDTTIELLLRYLKLSPRSERYWS